MVQAVVDETARMEPKAATIASMKPPETSQVQPQVAKVDDGNVAEEDKESLMSQNSAVDTCEVGKGQVIVGDLKASQTRSNRVYSNEDILMLRTASMPLPPDFDFGQSERKKALRLILGSSARQHMAMMNRTLLCGEPATLFHESGSVYTVGNPSMLEEKKRRQIRGILNRIVPSNVEKILEDIKDRILGPKTLDLVVMEICNYVASQPAYSEMYADLCLKLTHAVPEFEANTGGGKKERLSFHRLLLSLLQTEVERERLEAEGEKQEERRVAGDGATVQREDKWTEQSKENGGKHGVQGRKMLVGEKRAEEVELEEERERDVREAPEEREERRQRAHQRMLRIIHFMGELFNRGLVFERNVNAVIRVLLNRTEDEENVIALCRLMKLIYENLENPMAQFPTSCMTRIVLLSKDPGISLRVRLLLRDVLELPEREATREGEWLAHKRAFSNPIKGVAPQDRFPRDSGQTSGQCVVEHRRSSGSGRSSAGRGRGGRAKQPLQKDTAAHARGSRKKGSGSRGRHSSSREPSSHGHYDPSKLEVSGKAAVDGTGERGAEGTRGAEKGRGVELEGESGGGRGAELGRGAEWQVRREGGNQTPVSEEEAVRGMEAALEEYLVAQDRHQVERCLQGLESPQHHPALLHRWLCLALGKREALRRLLVDLLVEIVQGQKIFSQDQLKGGFYMLVLHLGDLDNPKAPQLVGRLAGCLLSSGILSLSSLTSALQVAGYTPGSAAEAAVAVPLVKAAMDAVLEERGLLGMVFIEGMGRT